jgi:centriolar protein POC1
MKRFEFGTTMRKITSKAFREGSSVTIKAHSACVRGVRFSCDGQLLVSCSDDKSVKVWKVNEKKFLYSLNGHTNWVRTASFSPDSRLIASSGDDKVVQLWDADQRRGIQEYSEHSGIVNDLKFHPDGTCLASCS